jgi:hypothetical protein
MAQVRDEILGALGAYAEGVAHLEETADRILSIRQLAEALRLYGEAAEGGGWIKWPGGKCPVPEGELVDVLWNNGAITRATRAGTFGANPYAPDLWAATSKDSCFIRSYRLAAQFGGAGGVS